jgi:hypothetical protein
MRKIALFVALAMIAASPAMAQQKKSKKAAPAPAMTAAEQHNDNGARLVRDSLPMWLPSWAQPVYQGMKKNEAATKPAPAKQKAKKAKTAARS